MTRPRVRDDGHEDPSLRAMRDAFRRTITPLVVIETVTAAPELDQALRAGVNRAQEAARGAGKS
jgi:hypothetical protein